MSGQICFVAFISPYAADREFARKIHKDKGLPFIECHIAANLEKCEKRDVKGLYKKARLGEIKNFTGISDPYEEPNDPELRVETGIKTPEECAAELFVAMEKYGILSPNKT
jgi:adenylylsulfate kinase-like enzyme